MRSVPVLFVATLMSVFYAGCGEDAPAIGLAKKDANGVIVYDVRSPYQSGNTPLRVLPPDALDPNTKVPVVFVLPVEAGIGGKFGDGLEEERKQDLHNRYKALFVAPSFSHLPWYADHPDNLQIRQESYFLKVVLPFIDQTYPVRDDQRLLLGFSKSGYGAFALLLRHPELFQKAVAWDSPLMLDAPGKYGSGDIFGTARNFEQYRVGRLLEASAGKLGSQKRLAVLGYGNFHAECQAAHGLLDSLKIPHAYSDGPKRPHVWQSGWVPEAAAFLLEKSQP
jgi:esterase/lipase superfamily enzyme